MAELAHLGSDGIRFNDGLFDTNNRYFREVSTGAVARMVLGPSIALNLNTVADRVEWSFKVGGYQMSPDGLGYPTNTLTEFAL